MTTEAHEYAGLLAIGDPHLASRTPGFRKDDYPRAVLDKLAWSLSYAREQNLLPALLGDVFHWPRDNTNWLLVKALSLLDGEVIAIYGNHDCAENTLGADDSLQVLVEAGKLRLINADTPYRGRMCGRDVIVGGSPWGQPIPDAYDHGGALVFWLTHHDLAVPGYEKAVRFNPRELPGISLVINGHIHRPLEDVVRGQTTWATPGNIARVASGEAHRQRIPSVLHVDVTPTGWTKRAVGVPHEPYDAVFHVSDAPSEDETQGESAFVQGLAALQRLRTVSGAGLEKFLELNLSQFPDDVAAEIRELAKEVTP